MKKISWVLVALMAAGMSMTTYAEDSDTSSSAVILENESGVTESSTMENTLDPIQATKVETEKVAPHMINGVTDSEWLARLLRNSLITQAEYDDNIAQLEAATSTDERGTITNRLLETNQKVNGFTFAFGERYVNSKGIVDLLKEAKHITEKEAADFYAQLDACDSLEDLQKVSDALDPYIKKYYGEGGNSNSREETSETTQPSTTTETTTSSKAIVKVPANKDKKGNLPQTGEEGSFFFVLVGSILIGGVALISWSQKEQA